MEILQSIGDKIGFDWRLSLTHLINFLLIFFLLVKFALPKLKSIIEERTKKIKEGLAMREDADKIVESAKSESTTIINLANKKYEEVVSKSEIDSKVLITNANTKASEIIAVATKEREESKTKGMNDAENIISADINKIITQISDKAFAGKITSEANQEFVSSVFKENYGK